MFVSEYDYKDIDEVEDAFSDWDFIAECEGGWQVFKTQTDLEIWEN